jgi:hypothetical protein
MNTDFQDLQRRMAALPPDELLDLVAFDVADYKVEALDLARDELYKRGYSDSVFIAACYLCWLALRRSDPQQAGAFAIGFACGVSFMVLVVTTAVPWYGSMIIAECLGLWILIQVIRKAAELFDA